MEPLARRLLPLSLLGVLLLFSPLLGALNRSGVLVGGVPLVPAYLFAVWGGLVVAAWFLGRRGPR